MDNEELKLRNEIKDLKSRLNFAKGNLKNFDPQVRREMQMQIQNDTKLLFNLENRLDEIRSLKGNKDWLFDTMVIVIMIIVIILIIALCRVYIT